MEKIRQCRFQANVDCEYQAACNQCGWNPDVKKKRILQIKNRFRDEDFGKKEYQIIQYMIGIVIITLNDKTIMGRDTLGRKRMLPVVDAIMKNCDLYWDAIAGGKEADRYRAKMSEIMRKIAGDEFVPFKKRYERLLKIKNEKSRKKEDG